MRLDIDFRSRENFPFILNQLGLLGEGAEVGVQRGVNASHIRRNWNGQKLYMVDPWKPYFGTEVTAVMHESYLYDCKEAFAAFAPASWEILRMTSLDGCALLTERKTQLDWVYLDGAHEYEKVVQDIGIWWMLVKSGGVIAGHDYVPDGWHRNGDAVTGYPTPEEAGVERGHCGPFEVIKAVQEFFGPNGHTPLELYLSDADTDLGWRSWMVVKP